MINRFKEAMKKGEAVIPTLALQNCWSEDSACDNHGKGKEALRADQQRCDVI